MNDEERTQAMNDAAAQRAVQLVHQLCGLLLSPKRKQAMSDEEREQWLKIRKEAAVHIDPETAEVCWRYAQVLDPYGVGPPLPDECQQTGRAYFARAPGSDVWVCFYDLPEQTRDALWSRHRSTLAFPSGVL